MQWLKRLFQGRNARVAAAPATPSAAPAENRNERRVPLGAVTQLYRRDTAPVPCVVADASPTGVRLIVDEAVAVDSVVGVIVHFNGYFIRLRARVVWTVERAGRVEVGAATLRRAVEDGGLMENFARWLRWRESAGCAA